MLPQKVYIIPADDTTVVKYECTVLHSQIDPAWHCIQLVSAVKTRDSLHAWDSEREKERERD